MLNLCLCLCLSLCSFCSSGWKAKPSSSASSPELLLHETTSACKPWDPFQPGHSRPTYWNQASKLLRPDSCNGEHSSYSFFPICDWVGNWPHSVIPSSSSSASSSPLLSSYSPLQQQKANSQKQKQKRHNTHSLHTSLLPISSFERSCSSFFLIIILTNLLIPLRLSLLSLCFPRRVCLSVGGSSYDRRFESSSIGQFRAEFRCRIYTADK